MCYVASDRFAMIDITILLVVCFVASDRFAMMDNHTVSCVLCSE